ncbi:DUF2274 domain-containing protein [Consotaella salsifontis]|uniref:DUF2274 domain-containing protein n=1 Tax=Consotaella salsifontis TaxID=1365950 RepID=A0A1T4Q4G1_9HYPH|nr:DUF2274 domain-containing protein [Consotaella salsifontis]SJZ98639.1 hypothetical protein SAMN05428963_104341 [Consotaella salsifontis]
MPQLRLGPLPKVGLVRLTITLSEPLKEELDQYAAEHSRLYEPVETTALIPHMLEAFIRSDRGWRSRKAKGGGASRRVPTLSGNAATSRNSDGDNNA